MQPSHNRPQEGLRNSKYGIVVLSKKFFDKCSKWTDDEVNALFTKKRLTKEDLILPVWLGKYIIPVSPNYIFGPGTFFLSGLS